MGKILECGGSKTFQNLEQCHEIQGEFKKIPLYYLKNNFNNEERNKKNKNNNIYDGKIKDPENELNLIIYNSDEFHQDKSNSKNIEKEDYTYKIMDSIKLKKAKLSKSFDKDKIREKNKNPIKSNNIFDIKDSKEFKNFDNKLKNKDQIKDKQKNVIKRRLIYNYSENNIKSRINWNNKKKKDIIENKINSNQNQNKIINNIYKCEKNKKINYVKYNNINQDKFFNEKKLNENDNMCELISKKIENKLKKRNDNSIKRNKSQQIKNSFSKSENNINSKFRFSLKKNKGNYAFNRRTKPKLQGDNNKATPCENESRRITYLTSENKSPKSINDNYFISNEEYIFNNLNKDSKANNTFGKLKNKNNNFYKFIPHNIDENRNLELLAEKNIFDLSEYNFNLKRRHHSDNIIINYKKEKDENNSILKLKDNKDIIKVKILFKGTQINKTLLNNSVNNIFILNYNLLSKISYNSILYDGNIYKVTNTKKGESKLIMRYFQITKLYFKYFNSVQSLLLPNNKPLDFFEIKKIKNIEIIDINLLKNKNKNEQKIKFAFVVNLIENINFFIFATNDRELGMNVINILNLIKKYFDDGKDLFK